MPTWPGESIMNADSQLESTRQLVKMSIYKTLYLSGLGKVRNQILFYIDDTVHKA